MNLIEFTGEELQAELDRRRLERMLKGVEDTDLETELTQRMIARMKREERAIKCGGNKFYAEMHG